MTIDNFPRWYELAVLAPHAGTLAHRLQSIQAYVAAVESEEQVLDLVGASFWAERARRVAELRTAVRDHDPFFPLRGRAFELQVVAAAALIVLMESRSRLGSLAALASTGPLFLGIAPPFSDLKIAIISHLDSESVRSRGAAWGKAPNVVPSAPDATPPTSDQIAALSEELDVIWWLHNASALRSDPVLLAADLALRTRFLPGLHRARAILADALRSVGTEAGTGPRPASSLPTVTAQTFDRLRRFDKDLFPVHASLAQVMDLPLPADDGDIAEQAYRECLALLVLGGDQQ